MKDERLEAVFCGLKPQLCRIARRSRSRYILNATDDLLQELALKLLTKPVPSGVNSESYVVKSFKNLIRDRIRSCNRRRARDDGYVRARRDDSVGGPDSWVMQRETLLGLERAVERGVLRGDHKHALWAWVRNTLDQFADHRGVSRKTAAVWALRARVELKTYFEGRQDSVVRDF